MMTKEPFAFLFCILASIGLFLSVGIFSSAGFTASPRFQESYDHYFTRNTTSAEGVYRKWFDRTIFNLHARSSLSKNDQLLHDAIRGSGPEAHKFLHSNYRTMDGEFGETWNFECLLLLIYVGDDQFAELLAKEDDKTRKSVRNAITFQVNARKDAFPATHRILLLTKS